MTRKQKKVLIRILVSATLLVVCHFLPITGYLQLAAYLVPYLIIGYDILKKAVQGIGHKEVFDENFLMAIATVGAFALGEYLEGSAVMLFYQVGELFQSVAVGKSRKSIAELMDIRPDYANVESTDGLKQVDPAQVAVGTVIVVKPGEKVPLDGTVLEGSSAMDTSALTGESLPRQVNTGDAVISGCINQTGLLKITTTKEFGQSTVNKILEMVESAGMKKARSEAFISRFAHYYTPAVCLGALLLALLPPLVSLIAGIAPEWAMWIGRALTFLVISCPCALVISIPLSFFGGIGGASRRGVLVKGSNDLENLSKAKIVVFDKTGTLTRGVFEVTAVHPQQITKEKLLELAAQAEYYSDHPISRSLKTAYGKPLDEKRVTDVKEIAGHGITALVDGQSVAAGNGKLMDSLHISWHECHCVGTVVHIAVNGEYMGHIVISDVIKEHSAQAIQQLKTCGVAKTVMLTGDSKKVAENVSAQLHMDETHAELLPQDKVIQVEKLLSEKGKKDILAFVGDGINDAPVLTRADVGIAMGALGSDAAIEAADVVLMDDDPAKIALAMKISRKCLKIVYENIVFALAIKLVCLLLGALGIANMWIAIFADVGVMVLAVLNATRALSTKNL